MPGLRQFNAYLLQYALLILLTASLVFPSVCWARTLILNTPTNPPITTPQGDGFLDIVVGEALRRNNLELDVIKLPAERALRNANDGIEDGDISRIAGLEQYYPNLVRIPEKLFDMEFVVFTNNPAITRGDLDTLRGFHIGIIRGWKIIENKTRGMPNITAVRDEKTLFNMLEKKRIDAAIYSRWMGSSLTMEHHIPGLRLVEPPLASEGMYMYLHKRHRSLVPGIMNALQQIKQEGLYEKVATEKLKSLTNPQNQPD